MKVDLPAPLAPTSPMTPGSTATVRSASAVTRSPYVLVSDWVAISVTRLSVGPISQFGGPAPPWPFPGMRADSATRGCRS